MVWHSQEVAKSTATPGKAAPKSEEAKGRALLGGLMPIWVWKKFTFFFCFGALFSFICQSTIRVVRQTPFGAVISQLW